MVDRSRLLTEDNAIVIRIIWRLISAIVDLNYGLFSLFDGFNNFSMKWLFLFGKLKPRETFLERTCKPESFFALVTAAICIRLYSMIKSTTNKVKLLGVTVFCYLADWPK